MEEVFENKDIIGEIIQYLPFLEFLDAKTVCKTWRGVVRDTYHPYVNQCEDYIAEYEDCVKYFYRYHAEGWDEFRDVFRNTFKDDILTVVYAHAIHNLWLRWGSFEMKCRCYCGTCDSGCTWDGINKRCDSDCRKDFYWTYNDEDMLRDITIYSDEYLGDGVQGD